MSLLLLVNLYSYFLLFAVCCLLFIIICTRRTPCTFIEHKEYRILLQIDGISHL